MAFDCAAATKPSTVLIFGFSGVLAHWVLVGASRAAPAVVRGFLLFILISIMVPYRCQLAATKKPCDTNAARLAVEVKVDADDFGLKCSASEGDHRGLLGLGWCVVGGVMPACVRKAEQSGCGIGTLGDMPAKGFNRVA